MKYQLVNLDNEEETAEVFGTGGYKEAAAVYNAAHAGTWVCIDDMSLGSKRSLDVTILAPTQKARNEFGYGYGPILTILTQEHIEALQRGDYLAFDDGEYAHFIVLGKETK